MAYSGPESISESMDYLNIIFVGFLGQGIGLFQGLYLYSTSIKIEMINNDANEIRTCDPRDGKVVGFTEVNWTGFKQFREKFSNLLNQLIS